MKMVKTRFLPAALCLALLLPAGAAAQVDTGSADFSRFVAIGDSLGAGFMSGSLIQDAQRNSYPSLVYQQVNGSAAGFEQPLVSTPGIPGILQLQSLVGPVIAPAAGFGQPLNLTLRRPYDNLSVPGFRMADATQTFTDNGGLADLILRGLGSQAQQAAFLQPTFALLWLGNNDVLGAATTGVAIEGLTLTPVAEFEAALAGIGQFLAAAGTQQAVIANIPNVTSIPFVTTLPPIVRDASGQPVVVNGGFVPLIAETSSGVRPLVPGQDFVLLTAGAELAAGLGVPPALGGPGPLSTLSVLDSAEVALIQARVGELNAILAAAAAQQGAAFVDVNAIFDEVASEGLDIGGIPFSEAFLTGGLFSLDGVHATPLGYAIIANEFIHAINETYGGAIPPVDLGRFIFGPEGRMPMGPIGTLSGEPKLSRRAWKSLSQSLRLPSKKQLKRALRKHKGQTPHEARAERREQRREWRRAARAAR